ncbi:allophanate hydrolase subunit 1 [Nocardioidaceae bacterium SCSIO 66511]|nr:allophanate hydrolase subunit 1 [Nocardioidaceae bacterium SCSIO 66511]
MSPALLPYGDRAVLAEFDDTARVVEWSDALRAAALPEVDDIVPAARSVLVVGRADVGVADLERLLLAVDPDSGSDDGSASAPQVEIPVRYDGPDLAEVAMLTGLTEREVVRAHTATTWRVAFGGFAPGFAYLVGGDPALRVRRRDEARTRVPAGAVGLAGEFSGVYPRSSPGGWQLIGTTERVLWDLDRDPPALLAPGSVVRFTELR